MNGKTDRVIRDRYEKLVLDKVMRNRKKRQCVDKDDSMTDMTDLKQVIHFLAIILFLVIASNIVVTMYTIYHFGTILESNS